MRATAESRRSGVMMPLVTPSIMKPKSSVRLRVKRNTSAPAAIDVGTPNERGIGIVKPAIVVASVTTSPLKPSLPRSRSPMISGARVAGMMSASARSGRNAFE